ncbi:MAG: YtxH domain-containing protein [Clostridiaceae bacterium]|jgi:gas vesicle protein|nr:YtxH domain-containing protein [Clostridiaceae bacterium]
MFDSIMDFFGVESKSKARNKSFLSFLGGIALGASAALLLAPQSGEETREMIKDTAVSGAEKTKEFYDKAAKEVKEKFEEVKQKVKNVEEIVEEAAEDIAEEVEEAD